MTKNFTLRFIKVCVFCMSMISILYAQNIKLNFNCLSFEYTADSAYAEMQFLFLGSTMIYVPIANQQYQGEAVVDIDFQSLTDKNKHFSFQRHFTTEIYADTLLTNKNNTYQLLRLPLPKDKYMLNLHIVDANDTTTSPIKYSQMLDMTYSNKVVGLSTIQLLSEFEPATSPSYYSKHGWEYLPYFSNFYPEYVNSLSFWVEIYHTDPIKNSQEFVVEVSIVPTEPNETLTKEYHNTKMMKVSNISFLMNTFDISELPSGNYSLQIEVKDKQDTIYAYSTLFFQRSNPSVVQVQAKSVDNVPFDTLKLYLNYMHVIVNDMERAFIENFQSEDQYEDALNFFYHFWNARNAQDPQAAWAEYYKRVQQVNYNYSTLRFKGYKTDRGVCYLKYGPPSEIEPHNFDGTRYPYEIWYYYEVPNGQINVYFVFYNPDKTSKNYRLLHSTMKGEIQFPNWEAEVKAGGAILISDDEDEEENSY